MKHPDERPMVREFEVNRLEQELEQAKAELAARQNPL